MKGDDITDAFSRWRAAHDAFLAAEQQLFNNARTGAPFCTTMVHDADPLLTEVQAKRAHADGLLLAAMKLLHEHRMHSAHNPSIPSGRVAASPTSPPSGG